MSSVISHKIKGRAKPKDVFITPLVLSKKQIDMIDYKDEDVWYDPFRNSGSYYNQYPNENKDWSEILDGEDFFEFHGKVDIIASNPPYSILDKVLRKSIDLNPRVISYLLGVGNLTPRRIQWFNESGYSLTKLHMCKVFKWYGMSFIVQFEKIGDIKNCISYDRTVWR